MDILSSFTRTQVEGGKWKNISKGKMKLKEKGMGAPFLDANQEAFVNVPL
jgi:hypothetical protein